MLLHDNPVIVWSTMQLGLHMSAHTYNVFTVTVLSYLWQLSDPPPEVYNEEGAVLRKLSRGPGNWCTSRDLWYMI